MFQWLQTITPTFQLVLLHSENIFLFLNLGDAFCVNTCGVDNSWLEARLPTGMKHLENQHHKILIISRYYLDI